jgi:hypothetical protein
MTSSTSQQHHDAHAVPCRTPHSLRRRAVHRHDSEILCIELEPLLDILPDRHGTAAGEPELIGGYAAVCVALDDDGALCKGLAVRCESCVQDRLSLVGQLLPIRSVLEQLRTGHPDSPVRAVREGSIAAILFRGDIRQAVIAPLSEEPASLASRGDLAAFCGPSMLSFGS